MVNISRSVTLEYFGYHVYRLLIGLPVPKDFYITSCVLNQISKFLLLQEVQIFKGMQKHCLKKKTRNISKTSLYIVNVVQRFKFRVIPVRRNVAYFEGEKSPLVMMVILLSSTEFFNEAILEENLWYKIGPVFSAACISQKRSYQIDRVHNVSLVKRLEMLLQLKGDAELHVSAWD